MKENNQQIRVRASGNRASLDQRSAKDGSGSVSSSSEIRACKLIVPLESGAGDSGILYHASRSLLLAHEDKQYEGAIIASLSIP